MSWNIVDYVKLFLSISPIFIMIVYWIVSDIKSRHELKKQLAIYDAEPKRDEVGHMTRMPTYSPETCFPNYHREEYGLPPIENDTDRVCIGDRVCAYFWREMGDGRRHVIGTLEERTKLFDANHPSNEEYVFTIRCDNGEKMMFYDRAVQWICRIQSDKKGEKSMPHARDMFREEISRSPSCRELLAMEHPEKIDAAESGGCVGCPSWYGYMCEAYLGGENCLRGEFITNSTACRMCWNRDVTEVTHIESLEKTDKLYRDAIGAMRAYAGGEPIPPELERKEKYKAAAVEYKALYDAMMDAGFDSNKAFMLTKTIVNRSLDSGSVLMEVN